MSLRLSNAELVAIEDFRARKDVVKVLGTGGRWAIVFGPSNGIGMPVEVTAQSADGSVTIREDVTDVSCW